MALSPETLTSILRIKKQQDQDAADRAAEAAKNAPVDNTRPAAPGPFGPLAGATAGLINGQPEGGISDWQTGQPQLDNSNLSGPVPTNLTPPQSFQPPPLPNTRPRLVTGTPVEQGGASPIGYNGGQLLNSGDFNYLNPRVPNPKQTYEGTPMPSRPDYQNSVDATGQHIGKAARFGAGFREGLRGGPLFALGNAVTSLLAPGHGNEEKYQVDSERFNREKAIDQQRDRNDPYYQNQLQTQQLRMEQPVKLQTFQQQQQAEQARQMTLEAQRQQGRIEKANLVGTQALAKVRMTNEGKSALADKNNLAKATLETRQIAAGLTGQPDYDNLSDEDKAQMVSDIYVKRQQQKVAESASKTNKNIAQTSQAVAATEATKKLGDLRDKQGQLIDDKISNPEHYYRGMTGDALYRAQMGDYTDALKRLDTEESQARQDRRAGVIDDDALKAKLGDIATRRTAAVQARKDASQQVIGQDQARRTGARTGPTLSTGHKTGDTVTVGGKQVRITKVHPDGKTFDYEEIK